MFWWFEMYMEIFNMWDNIINRFQPERCSEKAPDQCFGFCGDNTDYTCYFDNYYC